MRLIGNKTHGDLAEIGMVEFINQFMYDFKSVHVEKIYSEQRNMRKILLSSMKLQKQSFQ
jgi:hypothetical protein